MSARITKAEVAFLFPAPRNDAADREEMLRQAEARAHQAAVLDSARRFLTHLLEWPARLRARAELAGMSERELADLGLVRTEIDAAVEGRAR